MVIGTDDYLSKQPDFHMLWDILSKNEIELGEMIVTGRQLLGMGFLSGNVYHGILGVSPLRDGVDWLVSKLCSGEAYYHFISNITVFRLV